LIDETLAAQPLTKTPLGEGGAEPSRLPLGREKSLPPDPRRDFVFNS